MLFNFIVKGYRRYSGFKRLAMFSISIVFFLLCSVQDVAASDDTANYKYLYLFGPMGDFVKIDIEKNSVVQRWALPRVEGLAEYMPTRYIERADRTLADVEWRPESFAYNPKEGLLYMVLPKTIDSKWPTMQEVTAYHMLVLRVPSMEVEKVVALPNGIEVNVPELLITPDSTKLFVGYTAREGSKELISVIDVYDTRTMQVVKTYKEDENNRDRYNKPRFSKRAYFNPKGNIIYDLPYRMEFKGKGFKRVNIKKNLDLTKFLSDSQVKQLMPYRHTNPRTGERSIRYGYSTSARGINSVYVGRKGDLEAIFLFDVERKELVSPIHELPAKTSLLTTPDSKLFILSKFLTEKGEISGIKADLVVGDTGEIWIYDAYTGEKLREFTDKRLIADQMSMLCFSPDSSKLFLKNDYVMNRVEDVEPVKLDISFASGGFEPQCVFTDR